MLCSQKLFRLTEHFHSSENPKASKDPKCNRLKTQKRGKPHSQKIQQLPDWHLHQPGQVIIIRAINLRCQSKGCLRPNISLHDQEINKYKPEKFRTSSQSNNKNEENEINSKYVLYCFCMLFWCLSASQPLTRIGSHFPLVCHWLKTQSFYHFIKYSI